MDRERLQEVVRKRLAASPAEDRVVAVLTVARDEFEVDAMCRAEIEQVLDLGPRQAGLLIQRAHAAGLVEPVGKRSVINLGGFASRKMFYGLCGAADAVTDVER